MNKRSVKHKVIVNPAAGRGASMEAVPRVKSLAQQMNLRLDFVFTERPWHAADLAKQAVMEEYDAVIAMGGDGTANEVINGLMQAKQEGLHPCTMGVLCVGRGNDFAYGVNIPQDIEGGCRILNEGKKRVIDVGRVTVSGAETNRYFGNGVGIGFDAVVGFEAAQMKRLHGFPSYLVAALKTLFLHFNAPLVDIRLDEATITQPSLMISIMNGTRMGGGFYMAPHARPDDGLLDLCIAGKAGRLYLLGLMARFLKGNQEGNRIIRMTRSTTVTVEAKEEVLPAHADGETLCFEGKKIQIEVLKNQLEILCRPPDA